LILTDIQLPDITGIEAARQLKADEHTKATPIVAVTAFAMNGDRATILKSGCDDYTFNLAEFLKLVARYTGRDIRTADEGT
jgi:CheY-like chemotaxis protein